MIAGARVKTLIVPYVPKSTPENVTIDEAIKNSHQYFIKKGFKSSNLSQSKAPKVKIHI